MEQPEFKTDFVSKLYELLIAHRGEFDERRKGSEWKTIYLAAAQVYPEDRPALFSAISGKPVEPTTHGKVHRPPVRSAIPKKSGGCADCPDGYGIDTKDNSPAPRVLTKPDAEKALEEFESVEDLMGRFDNDENLLSVFAARHGIDIGKARTAEGIAKKIFSAK